jgi:hypothetical protein
VWVAGTIDNVPHTRYPVSFPLRGQVAHCQDFHFIQYRAGGNVGSLLFNDVWSSINQLQGKWTLATANAPWAPRFLASMTSDSTGTLYIAGGILAFAGVTRAAANDVWRSTNGGVGWTPQFTGAGGPAQRGVALLLSGAPSQLLWTTGVNTGVSPSVDFADSWASSDGGATWGQANPLSVFGRRDDANGEVMGNGILVITAGFRSALGPVPQETLNDGQT